MSEAHRVLRWPGPQQARMRLHQSRPQARSWRVAVSVSSRVSFSYRRRPHRVCEINVVLHIAYPLAMEATPAPSRARSVAEVAAATGCRADRTPRRRRPRRSGAGRAATHPGARHRRDPPRKAQVGTVCGDRRWVRVDPWDTGFVDLAGDQGLLGNAKAAPRRGRRWLSERIPQFREASSTSRSIPRPPTPRRSAHPAAAERDDRGRPLPSG